MFEMIALLASAQIALSSPNGEIEIRVAQNGSGYSVTRHQEQILTGSALGLEIEGYPAIEDLQFVRAKRQTVKRKIPLTATKAAVADDTYNAQELIFREKTGQKRQFSIEIRAYDDGVAWRYTTPEGQPITVKSEKTNFKLTGNPSCLTTEYSVSHENYFKALKPSQLDADKLYDFLMLCTSSSGQTNYAIVQAGIDDYAGANITSAGGTLQVRLVPRPDQPEVAVISPNGLKSSWRVVMMGDRAGDLIESHMIGNLSPQAQGDFSWVKPGLTAWDWWSGPTVGAAPTMERYKRFIDFAAASGFPYFLIDAGWALNAGPCCAADPRTDITQSNPAINIPELVAYAKARNVDLLLWVHWKHLETRMEEVLDTYQRWGIKGIKVDFMERDDQEMVQFYVKAARETAKRHLLLNMHGAYPPTGLYRTYPNYITQEGVLGAETNKFPWGQVTASHNVHLAYARMLLGPMDYTPGGFRNYYPEDYVQTEEMPSTRYTRGHALGQYVVYDSPMQMVSDDPEAYVNASGFDFVKIVPTAWDETKFVDGTPDSYVVLARRKGNDWYVGALNNEQARTVDVPLTFLPKGTYSVTSWQDGSDARQVTTQTTTASSGDVIKVNMERGGGAALRITKAN